MIKTQELVIAFVFFSLLFQAGCMATLVHDPTRSDLCEVIENNGWSKSGEREIEGIHYSFEVDSSFSSESRSEEKNHSIWINGTARGVAIGGMAVEGRSPPVIYDPSEAEIDVDGMKIKAISKLFKSDLGGNISPLPEVSIPANLNVKGKIIFPSFKIVFPIEITNPKTEYIFRPGTILLDGVRYPLPVYKSCYTPGKWWWNPIN